jgi:ketosteroid isomerase-like protein
MAVGVDDVARRIREAHEESFEAGLAAPGEFVAETVELAHQPPHPADGIKNGAEMAAMWGQEGAMLKSAMPDAALTDLVVASSGDLVTLDASMQGTAPDGSALDHAFHVEYTLRDGQIVRAFASYDPKPVESLHAAAFATPPEPAEG